ncbi:MAG: hypothetical protein HON23_05825, partial [Rickettsiales bacterium]|nr:hypothetical protein [Rickettsiales bacterium]
NLLKSDGDGSDNIYVIPTDNKFFIDLVNGLNDSEDNTIIAVTDVAVNSVTYSSTELDYDFDSNSVLDYDGIYQIASMSLNTSFTGNVNGDPGLISVNDCSSVTSGAVCFIAPGNTASLDSNGAYTNFDDLDESGYTNLNGTNYGLDSGGSKDGIDQGEYLGSAYVTSAIAIIAGAWSAEITAGSITMTEIVSKLKDTAITADSITGCNSEDGTTTTDAVDCGDGMINLLAAMDASFIVSSEGGISQPVMQTTASASNFAYSLANTSLTSALYFGDALTINATSILSKAVYNDSYNFSYDANLESKISSESDLASSRYAVLDYFDFDNDVITESEIIPVGANFSFAMTSTKSKYDDNEFSKRRIFESPDNAESDVELSNINFSQDLNSKVSVKMGFNSYDAGFDVIPEQYAVSGSISFASGNEYASLLGSDTGFSSLKFNVSKNLDSYIGFATSEENDSQYLFSKFNYDLGRSFVSFSLGTLIENDNFLGSKTSGAFGLDEGTQTTYYGLGFVKNIGSDIDFISKIDVGITTIDSNEYSVFKDFRDVRSQETSFALVKRLKGATFGVSYTEPMRVSSGDSLISVSTGQSLDGDVDLASEWVSLESSGKERNYEMFYTSELDNEDSITLNYVYITEANHIAANSDEQLFVLKYSKEF